MTASGARLSALQGAVAENLETAEHHEPDDFTIVTYSDTAELWNVAVTASDPINRSDV